MSRKISFEQLALRIGIRIFLGLVIYFLIMKFLGFVHIVELRAFNALILGFGIWKAIKIYMKQSGEEDVYLQTLALSVLTSLVAVLPFAVFIFFYMQWDTEFMQKIIENELYGEYLNPYIVSFLIFFEGMISGFFMGFTLLQYMKRTNNKKRQ